MGLAPDKKTNVPVDILVIAMQRGIPNNNTSYFKTPDGKVVDIQGQSILQRNNPQRIEAERQGITRYLLNQGDQENTFIYDLLADPNSDTIDNRYRAGVGRVLTRRFQPMTLECRVAVNVPARFEADRILQTLEGYANQEGVNPNQYEINVIVNHRLDEKPDETKEVILQFMREHPELHVNLVDVQFDKNHGRVGYARKLLTDITLTRAVKRSGYYSPLYIVTADADETKVDPYIVEKTIDRFDRTPEVDCLRGRQDRSTALIAQNHLCALTYRANQISELMLRNPKLRDPYRKGFNFDWNRIVSGGWSSAFTAEIYAVIDGYLPTTLGEDVAVGQLASLTRGHWDEAGNLVPYMDVTKIFGVNGESNFLRMGQEILTGISAYREDQFSRQDIKNMDELEILRALADYNRINTRNPENVQRFEKAVCNAFYFIRGCIGDDNLFLQSYAERYMHYLGMQRGDYQIVTKNGDVQLKILNWNELIAKLEHNRKIHQDEFKDRYVVKT